MAEHAVVAPSSAQRVIDCPASFIEEQRYEDAPREFTAEGTLAHDLIDMHFADGVDVRTKLGKVFEVDGFTFTVKQDMIDYVLGYIDFVGEHSAGADVVMGEKRVHYGPLVFKDEVISVPLLLPGGEIAEKMLTPKEIGFGRMDTAWVRGSKVTIVDFKYGFTQVVAERNAQGMLYALGILHELSWMGDFDEVEIIIYQPRLSAEKPYSTWTVSVDELMAFAETFEAAALAAMVRDAPYRPGEKACQFCNARAHCAARRNAAIEVAAGFAPATAEDFDAVPEGIAAQVARLHHENPDFLALAMRHVGEIEDFCKAVRAEVERRLLQSQEVPGFKLVEGRLGNRNWVNEAEAEAAMKAFKLKVDEMYDKSLISPTQAEKVLKKDKPSQWKKLQGLIHRAQGRPSVAPLSDARPALQLTATAEDFV